MVITKPTNSNAKQKLSRTFRWNVLFTAIAALTLSFRCPSYD